MTFMLQFIDFKARSRYKFLRFLLGLVSLPTQYHERSKVLRKSSYDCRRRLDHLQRIVKRTCWSDYLPRVGLSLSFLSSRPKKLGKNVLIILQYLTKLHAFMGKIKTAPRIIEKRCNAF